MYQTITLYTLNLSNVICQMYFNKTEKKKEMQILISHFISIENSRGRAWK